MDVNNIVSIISTVGFPVVCCGAMFWFINKTMKDFTEKIQQHIDTLHNAIDENTEATCKLVTTVEILTKLGSDKNV